LRTFRSSTGGNGAKFTFENAEIAAICANLGLLSGVLIKVRIIYRFSFSSLSSYFSIGGKNTCRTVENFYHIL
jgi:hypothetical protein